MRDANTYPTDVRDVARAVVAFYPTLMAPVAPGGTRSAGDLILALDGVRGIPLAFAALRLPSPAGRLPAGTALARRDLLRGDGPRWPFVALPLPLSLDFAV
jgi:hypothetical protein